MTKIIFRTLAVMMVTTLILETSPAYAIFGIRAARTVMAARKAKQMASSSDSDADKAYAEEKARFNHPAAQEGDVARMAEIGVNNASREETR